MQRFFFFTPLVAPIHDFTQSAPCNNKLAVSTLHTHSYIYIYVYISS
jgi:hypothetical protein